jgi:hypothetical protein
MGYGYQKRDYEIVDYQLWGVDGISHQFRGPKPMSLENNQYFTTLGGAQTFGCFCEKPFPTLLSKSIELDVVNIGQAGAGPLSFLIKNRYIQIANAGKFVVVQVMSGRSESNSMFESKAGRAQLTRISDNVLLPARQAYEDLLKTKNINKIRFIVEETRDNYVKHFIELLNLLAVPKILFWFSERNPYYTESFDNVHNLFGKFPHLVNREMIEIIKPFADYYVGCITDEGMPQLLISRFTGKPVAIETSTLQGKFNTYYPSPEMHQSAFITLYRLILEHNI